MDKLLSTLSVLAPNKYIHLLLLENPERDRTTLSQNLLNHRGHKQTNKNISSSERLVSCWANINSSVCSCACNWCFSSESRKDELQRLGLVLSTKEEPF